MVKPFDVDMLVKRIKQLYGERYAKQEINMGMAEADMVHSLIYAGNRLETVVTGLIKDMGIFPNAAGFHYLREAVIIALGEHGMPASAAKNIYPVIAGRHKTTESKVSRAIRNAIQSSLEKSHETEDKNIISAFNFHKSDMTNARIISSLASKAKLLLNK